MRSPVDGNCSVNKSSGGTCRNKFVSAAILFMEGHYIYARWVFDLYVKNVALRWLVYAKGT